MRARSCRISSSASCCRTSSGSRLKRSCSRKRSSFCLEAAALIFAQVVPNLFGQFLPERFVFENQHALFGLLFLAHHAHFALAEARLAWPPDPR